MSTTSAASEVKRALLMSVETHQAQLRELIESLPDSLEDLSAVEQQIRDAMLKLGQAVLQSWSEVADARVAPPECAECQEPMRHKGYVSGPLVTMLGNVRVRRARFRCEHCGREHYPHDERLRFLGHAVSRGLAKVVSRLGAQFSFAEARMNLELDYGVRLSKQLVQRITEEAGQAVLDVEDRERRRLQELPPAERPTQLPCSELSPEIAYLFGDGAMIHTEGDWHEIRVASGVAVDADGEKLAVEHRARFLSCADFGWQLLLVACAVGYRSAKLRAFIADGARWLWEVAATHFPDAVQILDWYHLAEHVHQAAAALYGVGSSEAKQFSEKRLAELWAGRASATLRALRAQSRRSRSQNKREALRQLIQYLEHNRERIRYDRYRALGLNVGSGSVESACKTLVGARCKQAGMRNWTRRGAEGVLRLRSALKTAQYDRLWTTLPST